MFNVRFYNYSKPVNSTRRPSTSDSYDRLSVNVKTSSSIINPVLELRIGKVPEYTYCYIEEFKRYYFITDITSSLGVWIISTSVDVLASFRTDIRNSTQYVARAASNYSADLIDTMYNTGAPTYSQNAASSDNAERYNGLTWTSVQWFNRDVKDGCVVFNVVGGKSGTAQTGNSWFMMAMTDFNNLIGGMLSYQPTDIGDVPGDIAKAVLNPIQYITSAVWFPVMPLTANVGTLLVTGKMTIGPTTYDTVTDFGLLISTTIVLLDKVAVEKYRLSLSIPKHPNGTTYPYLNLAPYSQLNLFFQPFGDIPIDTVKVYGKSTLYINWNIDYTTGNCIYTINDGSRMISSGNVQIGVPMPLFSISYDAAPGMALVGVNYMKGQTGKGIAGGLMQAGTDLFNGVKNTLSNLVTGETRFPAAPSNTEILDKVSDTIQACFGQVSSQGSQGSFLAYNIGRPFIYGWFLTETEHDDARFGRPCNKKLKLSTLSGMAVCRNAVVPFTAGATELEAEQVCGLLNSGVYIE